VTAFWVIVFGAGSFVSLEGIAYYVDSIDGTDNANGQ